MSMCMHYMYVISKVIENNDLSCPSRTSTRMHIHHTNQYKHYKYDVVVMYMYTHHGLGTARVRDCVSHHRFYHLSCVSKKEKKEKREKKLALLQEFWIIECSGSQCSDNRCSRL